VSSENKIRQQSLTALNNLITEIQPIIDRHVQEMEPVLAAYLVDNYSKYLKINLQEDIKQKAAPSYSSPFDELMDDMSEYHEND